MTGPQGPEERPPTYQGPPPTGAYQPAAQYPPNWGPQYANQYPPPYPYPPYPYVIAPGAGRPGTAMAAAVLGYVAAGLLFVAAMILFFGASFITDYGDLSGRSQTGYVVELAMNGVGNLVAGGLLIGGSVNLTGRSRTGRVVYTTGTAIVVVEAIYWISRWAGRSNGGVAAYAVIFLALVVVGTSLAWTRAVSVWLGGPTTT